MKNLTLEQLIRATELCGAGGRTWILSGMSLF